MTAFETILDEMKPTGNHTFTWNTENALSGIYFIKLSSKGVTKLQEIMLIK